MSFAGTWNTKINSPMGAQEGTLELTQDGDTLTGQMVGAQGTIAIEEGKADGDKATWVANVTSPMPIKLEVEATRDGDALTGNVKLGAFGTATLTGTRA